MSKKALNKKVYKTIIKRIAKTAVKTNKDICKIIKSEIELRKKSKKTSERECDEIRLWDKLRDTLLSINGDAIAANQIGILKRAILLFIKIDGKIVEEVRFINPMMMDGKEDIDVNGECCHSFPHKILNTCRQNWIIIRDDINGAKTYTGDIAVLLQHKVDHLNGILFIDRQVVTPESDVEVKKVGKNHYCPCKSGKKYKNCHMKINKENLI